MAVTASIMAARSSCRANELPGDPTKSYTEEEGLALKITGKKLKMDEDLHKALAPMPQMARAWENFRPRGASLIYLKMNAGLISRRTWISSWT